MFAKLLNLAILGGFALVVSALPQWPPPPNTLTNFSALPPQPVSPRPPPTSVSAPSQPSPPSALLPFSQPLPPSLARPSSPPLRPSPPPLGPPPSPPPPSVHRGRLDSLASGKSIDDYCSPKDLVKRKGVFATANWPNGRCVEGDWYCESGLRIEQSRHFSS